MAFLSSVRFCYCFGASVWWLCKVMGSDMYRAHWVGRSHCPFELLRGKFTVWLMPSAKLLGIELGYLGVLVVFRGTTKDAERGSKARSKHSTHSRPLPRHQAYRALRLFPLLHHLRFEQSLKKLWRLWNISSPKYNAFYGCCVLIKTLMSESGVSTSISIYYYYYHPPIFFF